MPENLTLGTAQFARMLEVLVAEQSHLRRHFKWYRLQKGAFYLLAIAVATVVVGFIGGITGVDFLAVLMELALIPAGIAFFALVPLFFLNLPFAWKLFQQGRLRRRLGLHETLRQRFKAASKKRVIMILLSVVGLLVAFYTVAIAVEDAEHSHNAPLIEWIEDYWLPFCFVIVGLSIPVLWMTSRGVDRLQEITRLRDRLTRDVTPEDSQAGRIQVSAQDYDRVARLEKMKTLEDREQSVRRGVKLAKGSIFAVQKSLEAQSAIERLPSKARLKVEETLFELMSKPRPKAAREEAGGVLRLPVPDASLALTYEVDDEHERIRLHGVEPGEGEP